MTQQFVMGRGSLPLEIGLEEKTFEYQLEFETQNDSSDKDLEDIERIGIKWINHNLAKSVLTNPTKADYTTVDKKVWCMSLAGKEGDCEPTPMNLAKELFLAMAVLFETHGGLRINRVVLLQGSSYIVCTKDTVLPQEAHSWLPVHYDTLKSYIDEKNNTTINTQ
jgi:hypothetical protein